MARSFDGWTHPGITLDRRTLGLYLGDLIIIVAIMAIGLLSHDVDPVASFDHTIQTSLPFVIGWTIVAPLAGVYAERVRDSFRVAIGGTILAWVGASLVGGAIRATTYFHGGAPAVFIFVTIGTGLLVLLPWRLLAVFLFNR